MNSETKNCQNCKNDFTIEPDDFLFYEKIKVPAPTFCPECRMIRRLSFGNYYFFYKRNCDKCNNPVVCIYSNDGGIKMFCNTCWWFDDWDGTEYGKNYNENESIFNQLIELRKETPFMALETLYSSLVNTIYTNHSGYQKNCFMTIMADLDENCAYSVYVVNSKDSLDCYRINQSELCYECTGVFKCYSCSWIEESDNCVDCHFCQSCNGCSNCVGCVNLKNKKYCILNVQYSKEEYQKILKDLNLSDYKKQKEFKKTIEEFWMRFPKKYYRGNSMNINVSGDYIYESKNTSESYMVNGMEDCKYTQFVTLKGSKDCFDYTSWGNGAELIYECYVTGEGAYNNKFSVECWPNSQNIEYSLYCINCKDCFACINLKKKQYCILNKQYTKEEYFKLKERIISDMKKNPWKNKAGHIYNYGEFLPPELSPYGYNESLSSEYKDVYKDKAVNSGFNWYDIVKKEYNITLSSDNIPDSILNTNESIKDEVIECEFCKRGFNISDLELELLIKISQPVPHKCSNCRHKRRFSRTNTPNFYNRNCDKCGIDIKTSYAPDRPEIVYCEKCYQQEVY